VLLELPVLGLHLLIPFLIFSCSLAMNLARRPGMVVTDDTVMNILGRTVPIFLSFFSSFLLHNLQQDPTARLSGEKRPDFFFLPV
jgi:hypothetical protein